MGFCLEEPDIVAEVYNLGDQVRNDLADVNSRLVLPIVVDIYTVVWEFIDYISGQ
jgi:hypothetical protein